MVRILLSHSRSADPANYVSAIENCGALAVGRVYARADTDCDGLLLCGGGDISPHYFGEENRGSVNIDTCRDECELALIDAYARAGKAVLGICRGCQVINVCFGGSLIQHLPSCERHQGEEDVFHSVVSEGESVIRELYGDSFTVNSAHHQALDRIGDGLRVTHRCDIDGVVEGIEHKSLHIMGVQWHPERICLDKRRGGVADGLKLMERFVDLCRQKQCK